MEDGSGGNPTSKQTRSIYKEPTAVQVELLYEMRAGHLAILGETSKYTPLAGLELIKWAHET